MLLVQQARQTIDTVHIRRFRVISHDDPVSRDMHRSPFPSRGRRESGKCLSSVTFPNLTGGGRCWSIRIYSPELGSTWRWSDDWSL